MTAVIVPTYKRPEVLREFLRSTPFPEDWMVFIVDGAMKLPEAWWSECVNSGVLLAKAQKADRVLITNDDARISAETIESLQVAASNYPDVILQAPIRYQSRYFVGGRRSWRDLVPVRENRFAELDWLSGQCLYCKTSVFDDVGLFDEKHFPQYFGDADWCMRAKAKGYRLQIAWGKAIEDLGLCAHNDMKRESLLTQFRSKRSSFYIPARFHLYRRHWRFWPLPFAVFLFVAVVKTIQARVK